VQVGVPGRPIFRSLLAFVAVAGVLAALWVPLAPTRLFDFDASNFALALDYFAPAAHQPQPPGYPLYVGLTDVVHWFVPDVALTFLIAGLLGSAAAVVMLGSLGERMFSRSAGICAALLLMSNPILWQTAMSDQVRIYLAVISIGVALVLWPGWATRLTARRFAAAGAVLGVLAGFRPEMLASMAPLWLMAGLRSRLRFQDYLLGALALAAGMMPWFVFLLIRVHGVEGFLAMLRVYAAEQASGSSVVFGASGAAAWKMVSGGLWWASLGVIAWLPAVLVVRWRRISRSDSGRLAFLAAWFLPVFLFSIVIHIAASGHSLGFIPVLCLAGGWAIAAVGETRGRIAMSGCLLAAVGLNVYFFFEPYAEPVREASYPAVESITSVQEAALDRIDRLRRRGPIFLVSDDAWVRWRILQYYYPEDFLIYMPAPLAPRGTALPVWLIRKRLRVRDLDAQAEMSLPACGTLAWLIADDRSRQDLLAQPGAEEENHVIAIPAKPGMHFQVGRYRLATTGQGCPNGAPSTR
jgi:hypothetical protein